MKKILFCLLLILSNSNVVFPWWYHQPSPSKTLFPEHLVAILICDTSNPKTRDCHRADIERMKKNLQVIATNAYCRLDLRVLEGKDVTKVKILQTMSELLQKQQNEWGLIVYYSGDQGKGPAVVYKDGKKITNNLFPFINVVPSKEKKELKKIKDKKIRHFIKPLVKRKESLTPGVLEEYAISAYHVPFFYCNIYDCYNTVLEASKEFRFPKLLDNKQKYPGLRYLFGGPMGTVLASSSMRNQKGYGIKRGKEQGGLFSLMLAQSLNNASSRQEYWEAILNEVKENCYHYWHSNEHKDPIKWLKEQHEIKQSIHYELSLFHPENDGGIK